MEFFIHGPYSAEEGDPRPGPLYDLKSREAEVEEIVIGGLTREMLISLKVAVDAATAEPVV